MIKRIISGIATKGLGFDFLSFIKEMAVGLELKGIVFEKNDGSIEIIAEGEEEGLVEFIKKIEKGGLLSPIENFYATWHEPTREFTDFSIGENQ